MAGKCIWCDLFWYGLPRKVSKSISFGIVMRGVAFGAISFGAICKAGQNVPSGSHVFVKLSHMFGPGSAVQTQIPYILTRLQEPQVPLFEELFARDMETRKVPKLNISAIIFWGSGVPPPARPASLTAWLGCPSSKP